MTTLAHMEPESAASSPSAAAAASRDLLVSIDFADDTLPALLARQVALTPRATAVICGDRVVTYADLDAASDRLAHRLLDAGLAPRTRIAVLLDRSVDLIVALIGVLKAGSAYIPLDPGYPPQRLSYVLDNARPAAVISRSGLPGSHPRSESADVFIDTAASLDDEADRAGAAAAVPLDQKIAASSRSTDHVQTPPAQQGDVAYVIYTSGSTGVPKGVQIGHRALANFLSSMRDQPGLGSSDTLLAVTTVAFDIAVLEIFLPLTVGATVVLARESDVADGASLRALLERHAVTVMQATPVTWQMLIDAGWRGAQLKMLCGGEALSRRLAEELLSRGGELWNLYGPTETTVWSSVLRVRSSEGPVLLGPAIRHTIFRVLDSAMNEVAAGDIGELFIGGDGVALGYVDLPEQTAQRFLADPFDSRPLARLYRTGDLVRRRASADLECLEFIGRADHQVKVRGHRIELGEIEATLLRHPDISQAVAIVRDEDGQVDLYAYVVLRSGADRMPGELLGELRLNCTRFLPAYMHPVAIMALPKFPLTPNGKVDRRSLPAPTPELNPVSVEPVPVEPVSVEVGAVAPSSRLLQGEVEQRLAAIWGSLLDIRPVDAAANFFALGGRSMLAAKLLVRIESEFGVRLTLPALFKAPTIAAQAQLLHQWNGRLYEFQQIVELHAGGSRLPLIAIHNTGVYCYQLSQLLGTDQPLTALQLFDPSRTELPTSLEDIATEYAQLIRKFQPQGPYQLLGWCVGGVLAFETARRLREQGCSVSFLALIDAWAPGRLRRMSKIRAWLSDRSYRTQLILSDWARIRAGEQTVGDFLNNRVIVKRLRRAVSDPPTLKQLFSEREFSGEHYDRWLASYLEGAADRYEPQHYDGRIVLLRSSREPRGWFLENEMGWRPFVAGIDAAQLEGNHFTVFRGEGLKQLAQLLRHSLAQRLQRQA